MQPMGLKYGSYLIIITIYYTKIAFLMEIAKETYLELF
jgi:hypothetical protein